jgi:hypothetical protein
MAARTLVLFFGEDQNDTQALISLSRALLPLDAPMDTKHLRRPPILRRDAAPKKRQSMASEIASFAQVLGVRRRVAVVVHRDCDAVEPRHIDEAATLKADLVAAGVPNPVPATPAWEIETWWMMFPDALAATRDCWRRVNYGRANVGMIENAKERLTRDLRPANRRCRDYAESDSIAIGGAIDRGRMTPRHDGPTSASLKAFQTSLRAALGYTDEATA